MKRFALFILGLFLMSSSLWAQGETHIDRGHNQIEIQGLQSIDISPVLDRPNQDSPNQDSIDMICQEDGAVLHVSKKPVLTLSDFSSATVSGWGSAATLNLGLTQPGGDRIKEFSSKNRGKKLAFIVNGSLLKAPTLKSVIDAKGLAIDPLDRALADRLALLINNQSK